MKAVGQFAGGINAYNAGKYTRGVMNTNAQNALNTGVDERDMIRYRSGLAIGQQITAQGGTGFQTGTGSALDEIKSSMINRELDIQTSRARASAAATNYKNEGELAYQKGKSAMAGGIIAGVGTIADEIASAVAGGMGGAPGGGGGTSLDPSDLNLSVGQIANGSTADRVAAGAPTLDNIDWSTLPGMG